MSLTKQVLLSLVVIAFAGGAWLVFMRPDLLPGWTGLSEASVASAVGPGGNADKPQGAPGRAPASGGPPGAGGAARGGQGAPFVVTAPVEIDSTGTEIRAIGTAQAAKAVTLYPQVTGVVAKIAFTPGGAVAAGDPLLVLDSADQEIAVERARVALDKADEAVARAERLSKTGNVTAVALSDASVAKRQAEIDMKSAELELAKRTIRAPFSGVAGLTDLSIGDLVNSQKAIATVDDMATVTVAFEVPERVAGMVAIGQAVTATASALPGVTIDGRISAVDSRVDPGSRTLKLEATLPNDAGVLRPGMAMTMALSIPGEPRPAVPSLAVQWDRQGSFVWKLDGDVVHRMPAQIIARRSGTVVLAADLAAGDNVVVEGVLRLREGISVVRIDEGGGKAPAKPPADGATPVSGSGAAAGARRSG